MHLIKSSPFSIAVATCNPFIKSFAVYFLPAPSLPISKNQSSPLSLKSPTLIICLPPTTDPFLTSQSTLRSLNVLSPPNLLQPIQFLTSFKAPTSPTNLLNPHKPSLPPNYSLALTTTVAPYSSFSTCPPLLTPLTTMSSYTAYPPSAIPALPSTGSPPTLPTALTQSGLIYTLPLPLHNPRCHTGLCHRPTPFQYVPTSSPCLTSSLTTPIRAGLSILWAPGKKKYGPHNNLITY